VGTDVARGEFVFYLDADDSLPPEALGEILAFARAHASDLVVVARITVEGEQVIKPLVSTRVVSDARLRAVFTSLTPHKLIRRARLVEHGIRFPEGRVTWEDGIFLAQVAPRVRRISVLADKPYYIKQRRPGRLSASSQAHDRARAAVEIVKILRRLNADAIETDIVALRLYSRLLRTWNSERFLRMPREKQDVLVSTMREASAALLPATRDAELPYRLQLRSLAFRTGRIPVVVALAESERDSRRTAHLRRPALLPTLVTAGWGRVRLMALRARRAQPLDG
jgi:hypothetical protein